MSDNGSHVLTRRDMMKGLEEERALFPETGYYKPRTRAECVEGERPCPYVSCRHHLYLDVMETGSLKLNFPDRDVDELGETCSLDVADRGGETLEDVGDLMNISKERIRQVEAELLVLLKHRDGVLELHDGTQPRRRLPVTSGTRG